MGNPSQMKLSLPKPHRWRQQDGQTKRDAHVAAAILPFSGVPKLPVISVRQTEGSTTQWECFDVNTNRAVLAGIASNGAAWREADKLMNEVKSRSEDVADWVWNKTLDRP
jgi:hypothetical protein